MHLKSIIVILVISFLLSVKISSAQLSVPADADTLRQVSLSNLKDDGKTMIALVFGQSNAANFGQKAYTPQMPRRNL